MLNNINKLYIMWKGHKTRNPDNNTKNGLFLKILIEYRKIYLTIISIIEIFQVQHPSVSGYKLCFVP